MTHLSPVTDKLEPCPLERGVAQFFFEVGYAACFAEVMIRNGMKPPFELSDAHIEEAWPRSIEAHEDGAEMARYLAMAKGADNTPDLSGGEVERAAPFEALLIEAYERGWREGCETLIEDYPDALIAVPHKDAMGEGCGNFMRETWPKLNATLSAMSRDDAGVVTEDMVERLAAENAKLRTDFAALAESAGLSQCEPCLAHLLETDDYAVDDNGCCGCLPAMGGDDPQPGPCYAYRSLDRTIAGALSTQPIAGLSDGGEG